MIIKFTQQKYVFSKLPQSQRHGLRRRRSVGARTDSESRAGGMSAREKTYFCCGLVICFLFLIALPVIVQADVFDTIRNGLVPCGRDATNPKNPVETTQDCTICHLFKLIQNLIYFMLYVSAPLATLAAVYIGVLFIISGGNPKMITMARTNLWHLVWGIFWVLGSWLVLNTILNFAVDKEVFPWPWYQINCQVSQTAPSSGAPSSSQVFPAGTLSENEARSQLAQKGITVNKNPCPAGVSYQNVSGGCTSLEGVKPFTIDGIIKFRQQCGCDVIVTAGTELGHKSGIASHETGNKLDIHPTPCIDQCIRQTFKTAGFREGFQVYNSPDGNTFVIEDDHWDATFFPK